MWILIVLAFVGMTPHAPDVADEAGGCEALGVWKIVRDCAPAQSNYLTADTTVPGEQGSLAESGVMWVAPSRTTGQ